MKKVSIILATLLSSSIVTSGQAKISKDEDLKQKIIALEKAGWNAWKDKNANWFQNNTTEECLWVSSEGINDKAQMIKSTSTDCNVKSVSLENFQFVKLNDKTVLLTYVANQDGYCGNNKLTNKIRASVNYVNRNGKWLEAFYMETSIAD
jgi:hypothetical protein